VVFFLIKKQKTKDYKLGGEMKVKFTELQKMLGGKKKGEIIEIDAEEMNQLIQYEEERYFMGIIRDNIQTHWDNGVARIEVLHKIPRSIFWYHFKRAFKR
jgi:hypothetical protein